MATNSMIIIFDKNNNLKINKYCQFDGYPSGVGTSILEALKKPRFNDMLDKVVLTTTDRIKNSNVMNHRDTGVTLMTALLNSKAKTIQQYDWCYYSDSAQYKYIVNLNENVFTVCYEDKIIYKKHLSEINNLEFINDCYKAVKLITPNIEII